VTGRVFFEEVIRENLAIGKPGQVQLIFDRRVSRPTPGKFRTRVITDAANIRHKRNTAAPLLLSAG